jgi:hypothetical protein
LISPGRHNPLESFHDLFMRLQSIRDSDILRGRYCETHLDIEAHNVRIGLPRRSYLPVTKRRLL